MLKSILVSLAVCLSPVFAACDYETLQAATRNYVTSQGTGAFASVAASATYTENFKTTPIQSSILSKALKIDHNRSLHDTTQCATYTEIVVTDPSHPYVIGVQMQYNADATQVTKIEAIVTDQGDWLFNATGTYNYASKENWSTIPVESRNTRAVIQAAGDAYLDLFNNKNVVASIPGNGSPNDSCNVGVPSGVALVNRRYVIDETVGAVDVFLNFGGTTGIPDSHEFRVENGKLRFVHTMSVMGN
ncbi:hypothetical protein FA13DRAFT_1762945 [Coprinellus micaceus]|uniref:DUF8021 domain-containing protein n=1 Tax=Coprinellus micaceus TaxID=71717 RepID=A0A4Y7TMF2_COPMI|nr:hypothetical protein FA13DRAFT_1762945 [Coprinellus micaceus]